MEAQHHSNEERFNTKRHNRNGSLLGTILIILGIGWILKETGVLHQLPGWHAVQHSFQGILSGFDFVDLTWPVILLVTGIVLIMGRRIMGAILILLAIFFFLPGIIIIPGILTIFFLPLILIILGIVVISRLL